MQLLKDSGTLLGFGLRMHYKTNNVFALFKAGPVFSGESAQLACLAWLLVVKIKQEWHNYNGQNSEI